MIGIISMLAAASTAAPPDFSWIGGEWRLCAGQSVVEEHWLGPSEHGWVGVSHARRPKRSEYEFIRIAPHEGGWAYLASPFGRSPPTVFKLTAAGAAEATFENPKHDYPRRIRYRREGDRLTATIDDGAGGKAQSWAYSRKAAGQQGCP
jgi:hypothetical protein